MIVVARQLFIRGEVIAADDLTIEGRVDGPVWCEGRAVTIASDATLSGEVVARDITVFGTVDGTLVASEVVDIRPEAFVTGRVVAARFILTEGASFNGRAEPQHLEAALRVARHRHPPHHDRPPRPVANGSADVTRIRSEWSGPDSARAAPPD
jgi:cytoskeletal protein CcmA (bactofilin family)